MLKIKSLIAVALLSSLSALSFAQAPGAPKNGVSHSAVATHKHFGQVSKAKHLKAKAHVKKHTKVRRHAARHQNTAVVHKV